jgi:hypothetical protein
MEFKSRVIYETFSLQKVSGKTRGHKMWQMARGLDIAAKIAINDI